jgi:hypothetical protein
LNRGQITSVESEGKAGVISVNSRKLMLMSGATAALLIYQIASATEAPSQALAVLQYCLLAGALLGLAGSLVKHVSEK